MSSRVKTLLMVSLALNAILFGAVLGEVSYYFTGYVAQQGMSSGATCAPKSPEAQLPDAKRKLLETILTPALNQMQTRRTEILAAKKEALRIIKAEPFDEGAYRKQIERILDLNAKSKHEVADAVVKLAKQFTPKERAALADIVAASSNMPSSAPMATHK